MTTPTIQHFPKNLGHQPIVPFSLNELKLTPNPHRILAGMTVVQRNPNRHDKKYSCPSPEPSNPSPISITPMNLSTLDGWETPQTTTDENIFHWEDEPRQVHWTSPLDETFHSECEPRRIYLLSSPYPPSPPRQMKRKLEMEMSFKKTRGVSQHASDAGGQ